MLLSNADPRRDSIKVWISKLPIIDDKQSWDKNQLSRDLQSTFSGFPVDSHRVHFKMKNTSGFDLIKPVFTFKLPLEKQPPYPRHPKEGEKCSNRYFTWSLSGSGEALKVLEVGNECFLSSPALPYWNKNADWDVWIRMVLDNDEFDVEVSVNCENADSFTQKIEIKPKELLESIGATKLSEELDEQMQADTEEKNENA